MNALTGEPPRRLRVLTCIAAWVSPETRFGGGLGGGEGARPYKQDTPRGIPRSGLKNAQTHPSIKAQPP
jgi:hypothetical protein